MNYLNNLFFFPIYSNLFLESLLPEEMDIQESVSSNLWWK